MPMDYQEFTKEIFKITKIDLNCYKEKQMHRRIDSLISKNSIHNYQDYVDFLRKSPTHLHEFLNHITINVSEFYRNPEQWTIFENEILPSILWKTKQPVIWSAACSTGDEPYTIAMILMRNLPQANFRIIATDIDKTILEKARAGTYDARSLEGLPKEFKQKHFIQHGDHFTIKDDVKKFVEFRHHNLLRDAYPMHLDLIVCRNVMIYFTEEAKETIISKFNRSLNPEGKLFIGSTEQILFCNQYNFKSLKTFFYEKEAELP